MACAQRLVSSRNQHRLRLAQLKMAASIGEKLRLEREARGIALRDISEQTRISMRYLEGIEADDYRRLPGGIFNRSFIRAYAKFVGYDEHEAIEEYTRTLREQGESTDESSTKTFRSVVYTDGGPHNRSPLLTLLLAIVILAILSLCVWAGLHFYQRSLGRKSATGTGQRNAPAKSRSGISIHYSAPSTQEAAKIQSAREDEHESTV